jgi:hypothetical protein
MLRSFCNIKILLVNYLGCEASLEMDISCVKGENSHIYSAGYPKKVTSVGKIRELFIIPMWKRFGDVLIILIVDFRIVRCSDHFKIFALPCLPKLEYRH